MDKRISCGICTSLNVRQFVLRTSSFTFTKRQADFRSWQLAFVVACTLLNRLQSWIPDYVVAFAHHLIIISDGLISSPLACKQWLGDNRRFHRSSHIWWKISHSTSGLAFPLLFRPAHKNFPTSDVAFPHRHCHTKMVNALDT